MKRLFFITWFVFLTILISCGGGSSKTDKDGTSKNPQKVSKFVKGVAAKGVALPIGSVVELRSTHKDYEVEYYVLDEETGEKILDEFKEPLIETKTEHKESIIITSTVIDNNGTYEIDVTDLASPYLVRVKDSSTGLWYYSVSDGEVGIANVNPYTDMLIRQWYLKRVSLDFPCHIDIDQAFTPGILTVYDNGDPVEELLYFVFGSLVPGHIWYGKEMALPNITDVTKVKDALTFSVNERYKVILGDVLTRDWVINEPYDALLDDVGFDSVYLQRIIDSMYYSVGIIEKSDVYYQAGKLYIRVWTKFGNTGFVTIRPTGDCVGGDMALQSTMDGINYYTIEITGSSVTEVQVEVEDFSKAQAERIIILPTYNK